MNIAWHKNLSRGYRLIKALVAAGLIFGSALLFFVAPEDIPLTTCEFYSLTGHSCLTCGMTRSLHAIANGDLIASFRYHLMGLAVFVVMLLSFIVLSFEAVSGKRLKIDSGARGRRQVVLLFAIVWLVYWGARLITELVA
jgi:hypothetical protein